MAAKKTRKTIGDNPLDDVNQSKSIDPESNEKPDDAVNFAATSERDPKKPITESTVKRSASSRNSPAQRSKAKPASTAKASQEMAEQVADLNAEPADQSVEPNTAEELFEREFRSEEPFRQRAVKVSVVINSRNPKAMAIVKNWSQWSVAAGVVPVPLLDTLAISGVQLKMVHDLCKFYGVKFEKQAVIGIIVSLVGGAITTSVTDAVTHAFLKTIPFAEQVLQPTLAFATTYSLGYVFVKHFEEKGTLKDFKIGVMRGYFREQLERSRVVFKSRKTATD
jgi:uncharacterized protein (DUF697 family)